MKRIKFILVIAGILILIDVIVFSVIPYRVFDSDKITSRADCAVFLYCGIPKHAPEINNESKRQLDFAYKLYKNNITKNILFSGGRRSSLSKNLFGSVTMAEKAVNMGIDKKNVFYEVNSYDTKTNLMESLKIIKQNTWNQVWIVSSKFHIMRAKYLAEKENMITANDNLTLHFVSYPYSDTSPKIKRLEIFYYFHYNVVVYFLNIIMPDKWYNSLVRWLRI